MHVYIMDNACMNCVSSAAFDSFDAILEASRNKEIKSSVLDQFSFAAQQERLGGDFLVESLVSSAVLHGLLVIGPPGALTQCLAAEVRRQKAAAFRQLVRMVQPISVSGCWWR